MGTHPRAQRRGLLHQATRLLRRPSVTLVLLVICVGDLFTLKPGSIFDPSSGSRVARRIGSLLEPLPRTYSMSADRMYGWVATEDNLVHIDQFGEYSWASVAARHAVTRSGFWGLTREDVESCISVQSEVHDPNAPTDLEARALDLFRAEMIEEDNAFWISHIRAVGSTITAPRRSSRVLWSGYVRDALSLAGAGALLLSIGWLGRSWRERRRWRRLGRGVCPDCGYQLPAGLRDAPCPECGIAHPARDGLKRRSGRWAADRALTRFACVLRQPVVSALLLALLVHDLLMLPIQENNVSGKSGSTVRRWIPVPALRADAGDGGRTGVFNVGVVRGSGGDQWTLQRTWPPSNDSVISIKRDAWSDGFWAPVVAGEMVHIDWNGNLGPRSREEGRAEMVAFLRAQDQEYWADVIGKDALGLRWSTLRRGYVHDALALCAAGALIVSLGWIVERAGDRRARLRQRRGLCGYCDSAVPDDSPGCPICGKPRNFTLTEWSRSA